MITVFLSCKKKKKRFPQNSAACRNTSSSNSLNYQFSRWLSASLTVLWGNFHPISFTALLRFVLPEVGAERADSSDSMNHWLQPATMQRSISECAARWIWQQHWVSLGKRRLQFTRAHQNQEWFASNGFVKRKFSHDSAACSINFGSNILK